MENNRAERKSALKYKQQEEERKPKAGDTLLDKANELLTKALQKGSLEEVEVAQAMLQGVCRERKEENQQKVLADNLQRNLEKKIYIADNIL
ncbi:hypothetical protein PR048_000187 [Dryococelus australis]|uniref:Uncharacterized protein n=1 Tax=Dryococelus australis TaxID=614101 RepID=A0ABQ9IF77_9NEOP|nr:hypothetical protein PR048_000187 [Dryococelus australis]